MSSITVTPALESELPIAARVLANAFADDPVLAHVVPPATADRDRRLRALFQITMEAGPFSSGTVDLARVENGDVLGVAAWEAPGPRGGGLPRLIARLPRLVRAIGLTGLARAMTLLRRFERHRPNGPHWYLAEIGVAAEARGRGIGARLLEAHLSAVDHMRQVAYLESSTPANRRLYARWGFREGGTIEGITGAQPVAMLRQPRELTQAGAQSA